MSKNNDYYTLTSVHCLYTLSLFTFYCGHLYKNCGYHIHNYGSNVYRVYIIKCVTNFSYVKIISPIKWSIKKVYITKGNIKIWVLMPHKMPRGFKNISDHFDT